MNSSLTDAHAEPHPGRWVALAVLLCAVFMNMLDVTIVNVALPSIQKGLQASNSDIEWVVAGYVLVFALALLPLPSPPSPPALSNAGSAPQAPASSRYPPPTSSAAPAHPPSRGTTPHHSVGRFSRKPTCPLPAVTNAPPSRPPIWRAAWPASPS